MVHIKFDKISCVTGETIDFVPKMVQDRSKLREERECKKTCIQGKSPCLQVFCVISTGT